MDVCGPTSPMSCGGNKYVFQLIDGYSHMRFIYLLKSKSECFGKFIEFQRLAENQTGRQIKTIISDNGGEFVNSKFQELFSTRGIIHQPTSPYTPQQNPIPEHGNCTLFEKVRVMLHDYQVPLEWWGEACAMAMFILNRMPSSAVFFQTPISRWNSLAEDLSNLHPFGCLDIMHIPKEKRTSKVDPTGVLFMLVGLTKTHHNYCLFNPLTKKIHVSHDCTFLDGKAFWPSFVSSSPSVPASPLLYFPSSADAPLNCALNSPAAAPALSLLRVPLFLVALRVLQFLPADGFLPCCPSFSQQEANLEGLGVTVPPVDKAGSLPKGWTYDVVPVVPPSNISSKISEDNIVSGRHARKPPVRFAGTVINNVPPLYHDALQLGSAKKWFIAIQNEFESLKHHGVLEEVPYDGSFRLLDTVWVFCEKPDLNENPVEAKARLCVKGFLQVENLDFHKTFAPTGRLSTLHFLLGLAYLSSRWLHFLTQGRCMPQAEEVPIRPQAKSKELVSSHKENDEDPCFVFLHVDDLVIGGRNLQTSQSEISLMFDIEDLGKLQYVLGMAVKRDRKKHILFLSQELYINNLLATFGMQACKSVSTPQVPGSRLLPRADTNAPAASINYRHAIGLLNYLVTCTRPDLAYSASCLAQFLNDPSSKHVLRYLSGTRAWGVRQQLRSDRVL
ncbi:hypothetical protein O181_076896 [Austropuccinia psidii MF-1]|uniref:Integrase catalytic domain-containing protein n=1 Tax=Austropuccinia psidii MF-1 TaxID=1389203 RepID=A0A9Q3FBB1_9BASI|nr:hypothetical protein [Austropuccinia psidii MF-1]